MLLKKILLLLIGFTVSTAIHYFLLGGYFCLLELLTMHSTFRISEFRGSFLRLNGIALAGAVLLLITLLLLRKERLYRRLVRDIPAFFSLINAISLMSISTNSIFPYQYLPWVMHLSVLVLTAVYFGISVYKGFPFYMERISDYLKDQTLGVPIIDIREVMSQNRQNRFWVIGILTIIVMIPLISKAAYDRNEGDLFLLVYSVALLIAVFEMSWISTVMLTSIIHSRFSPEIRELVDVDAKKIDVKN